MQEPTTPGMPDDTTRDSAGGEPQPTAPTASYREVTLAAIVLGLIIGAIMNAAITYAGLKIGFTIGGSAIAAVIGFGLLRGVLRKGSILETNIVQTIASAVNTPNSGVIFTIPVLVLLGFQLSFDGLDFWLLTLACVCGAILGGAFIIPLRKQMLDIERLRFPSATAVAAILKSPGAGPKKAVVLAVGIVVATLIGLPAQLPQLQRPAKVEDLQSLVERERISRADLLLTELIDGWITTEAAPEPLVRHGRLQAELVEAAEQNRPEQRKGLTPEQIAQRSDRLRELRHETEDAKAVALATIRNLLEHPVDRARLTDFPLELSSRAYLATEGRIPWSDLRDTKAGWAANPLFGYADLQIRMPRQVVPDAEPVDFAFNGPGVTSEVLTERADLNRNGIPDLLITDDTVDVGRILGLPLQIQLLFAIAPFAIGAGYLTGKAGLLVLAGGILAYVVLNPLVYAMGWMPETITESGAPGYGFGNVNRPLGIGLLLGGALMGVLASLPAIREAFKSIAAASKTKMAAGGSDELGLKVLIAAVAGALLFLFIAADFTSNQPINSVCPVTERAVETEEFTTEYNGYVISFADEQALQTFEQASHDDQQAVTRPLSADRQGLLSGLNPHVRAGIIALIGALWIWFAGIIIAQCTGMTDWSPISGMALLTVVLVLLLSGPGGVLGAVLIGAALCVAITCAADMMADLKTGYLVGAKPKKQQTVELIFTGIGPVITMSVLLIIVVGNQAKFGIPIGPGTDTSAPQAQALQAVITGVQGGAMPYALYAFGTVLGALLGLGAFSGLGVLVGLSMYLPFAYIATYGVGCVINIVVSKIKGARWAEEWGVPLAAGFIVGDAVLALGVNAIVLLGG
ncbi:MAG: OPT/YSL family transporter [Phycisphaerales bacterium]|nr:OPT/YSL family transporter [Planctomycetota bacterium]MCH8507346.1 OPT/YSL family transporter [Phycisphaerales bacterium]